jgi:hypothetical protein
VIVVLLGTVVLAPVVVMADLRRWRPLPVLLWLIGTALAVAAAALSVAAARRGRPRQRPRHGR